MEEIEEFVQFWKDQKVDLPNPEHYPQTFQWYVKLYKYYNGGLAQR